MKRSLPWRALTVRKCLFFVPLNWRKMTRQCGRFFSTHCVRWSRRGNQRFESLLLLQPTAPCRLPEDVSHAMEMLDADSAAVGVIGVSEPAFNPRWVCVEESGGHMKPLVPESANYTRRQDVPPVYRINGLLYLWRRDHVAHSSAPRYFEEPYRMLVLPEIRAGDIDTAEDLAMMELLLREGLIQLPWLESGANAK